MRKLVGAIAAVAAFSAPAFAADMAVKAPIATPVVAPALYSWTGCYLGANVGGGWGRSTGSADAHTPDFDRLFAAGTVPTSLGTEPRGAIGGGQVGCNYQTGTFVFGIETDIQASGIRGSSTVSLPASGGLDPSTSTGSETLDWFGTVRGRIGVTATPNLLLYGTGGFAYGHVKNAATLAFNPLVDGNFSGSSAQTRTGWVVGAGAEYAFGGNWSAKLEYLYMDLGSTTVREFDPQNQPITVSSVDYRFHHVDQIVRVGLNYKFGGGAIVAKY